MSRLATFTLALVSLVLLAGCSSLGLGDCTTSCAVAPAPTPCAPAPLAPVPVYDPAPCAPVAAAPVMGERPPNANPGEVWCYVRVPAVNRPVEEQICVQPATCRQEWVPPVTELVSEQICTRPEEVRQIPIPAQFESVTEQIMVAPGKTEWRRVNCEPASLSDGEQLGECWTLCEVPPTYESRCRQVCVQPEGCRQEIIPATYETRQKTVTVQEGYYKSIDVPPVYETRTRQELVAPSRWEWRRTTECEVPGQTCAPAGYGAAPMAPVYDSYPQQPMTEAMPVVPGPMPLPDDTMGPPSGTLPAATDPFLR